MPPVATSATAGHLTAPTTSQTRGETKKASFNLPVEDLAALKELAIRRHTTSTQVLRQALATELFIQGLVDRGKHFFSRLAGRGPYEEHHFLHMMDRSGY